MNERQAKKRYTSRTAKDAKICKTGMRGHCGDPILCRKMIHSGVRNWWMKKYGVRYIKLMQSMGHKVWINGKWYERKRA